jgi:hypothetical protein
MACFCCIVMVPAVRFLMGLGGCAVGLPDRRGTNSAATFLEKEGEPCPEDLVLGRVGAIVLCVYLLWSCLLGDNNQEVRNV